MNDLFYQAHSDTSREAAEKNTSAGAQRNAVYEFIKSGGKNGATTDEVRQNLLQQRKIHKNSIMSARVRELELSGAIVKTKIKRKTVAGRLANVYVTPDIASFHGMARDTTKEATSFKKMQADNTMMRRALLNIIIRAKKVHMGVDDLITLAEKGLGNENL